MYAQTDSFSVDQTSGTFTKEISINSCNNRGLVTNVNILSEISKQTKSTLSCKGKFYSEEDLKNLTSFGEKPLYVEIVSTTEDGLVKATEEVCNLIEQKGSYFEENVFIKFRIEKDFDVKSKVLGKNKENFKYVNKVTAGSKLVLKGKGTSTDPFYVNIIAPCDIMLRKAKRVVESLIKRVKKDHEEYVNEKMEKIEKGKNEKKSLDSGGIINPFLNPFLFPGFKKRIYTNIDPQYTPNVIDFQPENFQDYKSNVEQIEEMIEESNFQSDRKELNF